ncbi:phage tail protein [Acuticoccus sediminis]|uniref:Phage tail protein n=1 Tax=Acuticoccus sediminis TaxID=2184697 RepID=A0A8B2NUE5_9HYPH|nr:phage tail sheath C-terminal domain-containing protein [Acuticoccus sediminis]RAI01094.1 phage tail protein [Acuticoccus sediminis]
MVSLNYHHGTQVTEAEASAAIPEYNRFGVVGVIGTAEDADASIFPLNQPVLLLAGTVNLATTLGADGTLPWAISTLIAEGTSYMVVVRVSEGADAAATEANVVGSLTALTGCYAFLKAKDLIGYRPRVLIAPTFTSRYINDGLTSLTITAAGSGMTEPPTVAFSGGGTDPGLVLPVATAILGDEGSADEGTVVGFTITKAGENMTEAPVVAFTGGGGSSPTLPTATANVGDAMNPVTIALGIVAHDRSVTARAYVDGPGTTDAEAIAYRGAINNGRIMVIDHPVLQYDEATEQNVARPGSVVFAGVRGRIATEQAVSVPVDNKDVRSIVGLSRTLRYPNQTNYLNENQVSCFLKSEAGGFKTWGSRLAYDDPLWQFDSVRATADLINETIEQTLMKYIGKRMTVDNITFIVEGINAVLRTMVATDNIYAGEVDLPRDLNTSESLASGRLYLDVTFEPVGVIEAILVRAKRNIAYYQLLLDQVEGVLREGPITAAAG